MGMEARNRMGTYGPVGFATESASITAISSPGYLLEGNAGYAETGAYIRGGQERPCLSKTLRAGGLGTDAAIHYGPMTPKPACYPSKYLGEWCACPVRRPDPLSASTKTHGALTRPRPGGPDERGPEALLEARGRFADGTTASMLGDEWGRRFKGAMFLGTVFLIGTAPAMEPDATVTCITERPSASTWRSFFTGRYEQAAATAYAAGDQDTTSLDPRGLGHVTTGALS